GEQGTKKGFSFTSSQKQQLCRNGNCPAMLAGVASKLSISIIGPGRLGQALAENLVGAGYAVGEIVFPSVRSLRKNRRNLSRRLWNRATVIDQARFDADLVWL